MIRKTSVLCHLWKSSHPFKIEKPLRWYNWNVKNKRVWVLKCASQAWWSAAYKKSHWASFGNTVTFKINPLFKLYCFFDKDISDKIATFWGMHCVLLHPLAFVCYKWEVTLLQWSICNLSNSSLQCKVYRNNKRHMIFQNTKVKAVVSIILVHILI